MEQQRGLCIPLVVSLTEPAAVSLPAELCGRTEPALQPLRDPPSLSSTLSMSLSVCSLKLQKHTHEGSQQLTHTHTHTHTLNVLEEILAA